MNPHVFLLVAFLGVKLWRRCSTYFLILLFNLLSVQFISHNFTAYIEVCDEWWNCAAGLDQEATDGNSKTLTAAEKYRTWHWAPSSNTSNPRYPFPRLTSYVPPVFCRGEVSWMAMIIQELQTNEAWFIITALKDWTSNWQLCGSGSWCQGHWVEVNTIRDQNWLKSTQASPAKAQQSGTFKKEEGIWSQSVLSLCSRSSWLKLWKFQSFPKGSAGEGN